MSIDGLLLEFAPLFGEVRRQLGKQGFLPATASEEEWTSAFREFLRFLSVKDLKSDGGLPARLDEVWHACILNTRHYYALCMKLRGCFIHHTTESERDDPVARMSRVDQTVLSYRKRFREEPQQTDVEEPRGEAAVQPPLKSIAARLPYPIFVKTIMGKTWSLVVTANWTISDVKKAIHAKLGDVPPVQQRLIYDGIPLEDGRTCADYNLGSDCTVHLVRRVSGC
jgi:hypothetical protein